MKTRNFFWYFLLIAAPASQGVPEREEEHEINAGGVQFKDETTELSYTENESDLKEEKYPPNATFESSPEVDPDRVELSSTPPPDKRRPIWNIYNMANSFEDLEYFVRSGGNGIEFDVNFRENGQVENVYHGTPCDCFRICTRSAKVTDYLAYLKELTTPGHKNFHDKLILLMFDLKIEHLTNKQRRKCGRNLAEAMLKYYWSGPTPGRAYSVFSMESSSQLYFRVGFRETLQERNMTQFDKLVGIDFNGPQTLKHNYNAYHYAGITERIWQGDGVTNCLPKFTDRLKRARSMRDGDTMNYMQKVYWWNVDMEITMASTLRLDIDGMITNFPNRMINVLNRNSMKKYVRLATIHDNPFVLHKGLSFGGIWDSNSST